MKHICRIQRFLLENLQNRGTCDEAHHRDPATRSFLDGRENLQPPPGIFKQHQVSVTSDCKTSDLVSTFFFYYYYFCARLEQAAKPRQRLQQTTSSKTQGENQLLPSLVAEEHPGFRASVWKWIAGSVSYHRLFMQSHLASASVDFLWHIKDSVCLKNHFSLCPTLLKCQHLGIYRVGKCRPVAECSHISSYTLKGRACVCLSGGVFQH